LQDNEKLFLVEFRYFCDSVIMRPSCSHNAAQSYSIFLYLDIRPIWVWDPWSIALH